MRFSVSPWKIKTPPRQPYELPSARPAGLGRFQAAMSVSPTRHRPRPPRPATCEDWNEDARTTIPDTRRTANSAAKRSSKPDIAYVAKVGEDNTAKVAKVGKDGASDSGYSSQTGATVDSGGSSQRSRLGLAPLTVDTGAAIEKAKTTLPESKPKSATRKSPTKLPHTTTSNEDKGSTRSERCNCQGCASKKKATVTPLELRPPQDYFTLPHTSRHRGAAVPPSPQSARAAPPAHAQQIPLVNTAQPKTRPPSAQPHRMQRPMSLHAGAMPEVVYYPQPQVYLERRPQPVYVSQPTIPPPSYPPTGGTYLPSPVHSAPPNYSMPSPYEQPRSQPHQWPAESHTNPSHHTATYEPPIIRYGEQNPSYATGVPPQPYSQSVPRDSSFPSDRYLNPPQAYYERDDDYYKMPPPPAPSAPSQQRPTIHHAATTSAATAKLHPRRSGDEFPSSSSTEANVSSRRLSRHEPLSEQQQPRSRRQSFAARPSAGLPRVSYTSAPNEKTIVEKAHASEKRRRRASYYGQDALEREAERYQYDVNHAPGTATRTNPTIESVKLTRKKTQSQESVAGSHSSTKSGGRSRAGSDVKPRSGVSNRVVAGPTEGDGFTMRFQPGVKVDVKGDGVEGRTITFQQSGDGDGTMELRIGGRKGDEGSERSDRARGPNKPHSHSGASHSGTVSHSELGVPSRSSSRLRRASMYSDSTNPSRSASRLRRASHLDEVIETLRPGDRSRRPSRSRDYDDDDAFREKKTVSRSERGSPTKQMEDLTITERRLVRTESRSGRSDRSGYSGSGK